MRYVIRAAVVLDDGITFTPFGLFLVIQPGLGELNASLLEIEEECLDGRGIGKVIFCNQLARRPIASRERRGEQVDKRSRRERETKSRKSIQEVFLEQLMAETDAIG